MSAESSFRGIECFQRLNFHFVSPLSRACAPDLESLCPTNYGAASLTHSYRRAATAQARSDRSRLHLRRFRHPSSCFLKCRLSSYQFCFSRSECPSMVSGSGGTRPGRRKSALSGFLWISLYNLLFNDTRLEHSARLTHEFVFDRSRICVSTLKGISIRVGWCCVKKTDAYWKGRADRLQFVNFRPWEIANSIAYSSWKPNWIR